MKVCLLIIVITMHCSACLGGQIDANTFDFKKADSVAQLYPHHPINDLKILSDKLTQPLCSDTEKFRAIFKWVCINIDNDYDLYMQHKKERERLRGEELRSWEKKFSTHAFKVLVLKHRTVCTGYAYLVKELAFHAGITCKIIDGYGRNVQANIGGDGIVNHSWNAVKLNGTWYLCDPTWSSGSINPQLRTFVKNYDDAYFLVKPELFVRSHYPLDSSWILMEAKPTLHDFLNGPLLYVGAFRHNVTPITPDAFEISTKKGEAVSFQFLSDGNKDFQTAKLSIEDFRTDDPFTSRVSEKGETIYSVTHTFSNRGKYAVHISLDGSYAMSFAVTVK